MNNHRLNDLFTTRLTASECANYQKSLSIRGGLNMKLRKNLSTVLAVLLSVAIIGGVYVYAAAGGGSDPYWNQDLYDHIETTVMGKVPLFLLEPGLPQFSITDAKYADLVEHDVVEYYYVPNGSSARTKTSRVVDEVYTKAIRAAIEDAAAVSTGAKVIVPARAEPYYTGAIWLESNVNLYIETGAEIAFLRGESSDNYPIVLTCDGGRDIYNLSPFIYALNAKNIAITGGGTINGQVDDCNWACWSNGRRGSNALGRSGGGPYNLDTYVAQNIPIARRLYVEGGYAADDLIVPETIPIIWGDSYKFVPVPDDPKVEPSRIRPLMVQFNSCENIIMEDINVRNSPNWEIHPLKSKYMLFRGLDINSHWNNNDGIDPESSSYIIIDNVTFDTGDDCIAIKSGMNDDGLRRNMPTENMIIKNSLFRDGHGGVTMGSECSGGIRNIFSHDNTFDSPNLDQVLRLKTATARGGVVENLYYKDCTVRKASAAFMHIYTNYDGNPNNRYLPIMRNLYVSNFVTDGDLINATNFMLVRAYPCAPIENINIKDSVIKGVGNGIANVFSTNAEYFIKGMNFDNVQITAPRSGTGALTPMTFNSTPIVIKDVVLVDGEKEIPLSGNLADHADGIITNHINTSNNTFTIKGKIETTPALLLDLNVSAYVDRSTTVRGTAVLDTDDGTFTITGVQVANRTTEYANPPAHYISIRAQGKTVPSVANGAGTSYNMDVAYFQIKLNN